MADAKKSLLILPKPTPKPMANPKWKLSAWYKVNGEKSVRLPS